jgi:hypothetical protein
MLETELFALLEQTAAAAYTVTEAGEICSWNVAAERLRRGLLETRPPT